MLCGTPSEKLLARYSLGSKFDGLVDDRDISLSNTTTMSTDAPPMLAPPMFTHTAF
jgi:hypothetical protein